MSLLVACPSRGRPGAAIELRAVFLATVKEPDTQLVFIVDSDDPELPTYLSLGVDIHVGPPAGSMNAALNAGAAALLAADPGIEVVGFIGDDHRFRTKGWDTEILGLLRTHPGVAYGDDTNWGAGLPTMWFLSRGIAEHFGMGLPTLRHLYIDNYWKELAGNAGCLYYLPSVVIAHMHPAYGKAEWDEGYRRVNSAETYGADFAAFSEWQATTKDDDVRNLQVIVA